MTIDEGDHRTLALWAADCAERVLPYFEAERPNDSRPRDGIEAARAWVRDEIGVSEARDAAFAAHAAARDVERSAAREAARAAGHAAATAHVADHAPHAGTYAVKAAAATADAAADTTAPESEREWQRRQLPKHLRPVAFGDRETD
ncbi:putative immunity protein [Halopelagius fulvigenes]|uniref:Immunity protein n=1 Tax=Halopelagius fulvigenes TaxID=1198324 RepID=A0ABD5U1Q0_9EURY